MPVIYMRSLCVHVVLSSEAAWCSDVILLS